MTFCITVTIYDLLATLAGFGFVSSSVAFLTADKWGQRISQMVFSYIQLGYLILFIIER